MDVSDALDRISQIHAQLARTEVFRGLRPVPILVSGLIGGGAAALQPRTVPGGDPEPFVRFWVIVAVIAALISLSGIIADAFASGDRARRRRTRFVLGLFVPATAAGALATVALGGDPAGASILPGLWTLCFGLGIFAVRPFVPRGAGWVALFYLAAGMFMLVHRQDPLLLSGWRIGVVFGIGQAAAALILHLDLRRDLHGNEAKIPA